MPLSNHYFIKYTRRWGWRFEKFRRSYYLQIAIYELSKLAPFSFKFRRCAADKFKNKFRTMIICLDKDHVIEIISCWSNTNGLYGIRNNLSEKRFRNCNITGLVRIMKEYMSEGERGAWI